MKIWIANVNFGSNCEVKWQLGTSDNLVDYLEKIVQNCRESGEKISLDNINSISFTNETPK